MMKVLRRMLPLAAAVAVAAVLLGPLSVVAGAQAACTDEFTGAVSDAWENAGNWTAGVPTASTVACWSGLTVVVSTGSQTANTVEATNGGGLTVTGGSLDVPAGQSPVGNLTLSGGSLSGPFLDTGAFSWSGGTLEANVWQTGGGAASISGTASATLIGGLSTNSPLTITNPNVVAVRPEFGEPGLWTAGTMTFGPGVTIASGNANPQYTAASIASNAGPTYGFAGFYTLTLAGGGTTTVAAGTTLNPGVGGSTSLEDGSLTSGETLDVDGTFDGDVSAAYPYVAQLIEGSGVINGEVSVTGEATVDPGDPLGTLTVNGDYTQSNGQIGFAIAGTTPGSGYSQLVATGPIAFVEALASGEFYGSIATLGIAPENGFVPSIDDSFDVVHSPDGVTAVLGNAADPSLNPDDTGTASAVYGILPGPDDVILKVVPTNTALPTITGASGGNGTLATNGTAYVGDTLTCDPGSWSYAPTSFTYVWNGDADSTATKIVQSNEVGFTEWCTVYAHNANGTSVAEGSQAIHIEARPVPPTITPPVNTQRPAITGSPVEGDTLVEVPGSWQANGQTKTGTSVQWLRCETGGCSPMQGATADTYTLVAADVGATIRVEESTSDSAGAGAPALSDPTAIVTAIAVASTNPNPPNPPNTLIVSGKPHLAAAGVTLRVKAAGDATGFECALVRVARGKHPTTARPRYKACGATITFEHLKPGRYEIYVRAVGPGGVDKTPATYRFAVA